MQQILDDFRKYKFWEVPSNQFGVPAGFAPLMLVFTVREGEKSKTVRFSGRPHGSMLAKVIEDQVQSRRWRCPFVDDITIERCASRDRDDRYQIPDFLNQTYPQLLETYK